MDQPLRRNCRKVPVDEVSLDDDNDDWGSHWSENCLEISTQNQSRQNTQPSDSEENVASTSSWEGDPKQPFARRDPQVSAPTTISESIRNRVGHSKLAQQLQELLEEDANVETRAFDDLEDETPVHRAKALPLAQQFQKLVEESPLTVLHYPPRKGKDGNRRHYTGGEERYVPIAKHSRSDIHEDIVESLDSDDDAQEETWDQANSLRTKGPAQIWKRQFPIPEKSRSDIQEDNVENLDSDDDAQDQMWDQGNSLHTRGPPGIFQNWSTIQEDIQADYVEGLDSDEEGDGQLRRPREMCTSGLAMGSAPNIWERFRDALQSAPPETDTIKRARQNVNKTMSGFSARLQKVLETSRSQQMQFEKALQMGHPLHECSQCLDLLILGKHLEAQLTTCQCKLLQSPQDLKHSSSVARGRVVDVQNSSTIQVIFSSKITPELELEIGRVVRVHRPWYS